MLKALRWLEERGVPAAVKSLETVKACLGADLPDLEEVEVLEGLREAPAAPVAAAEPAADPFADLNAAPAPAPSSD